MPWREILFSDTAALLLSGLAGGVVRAITLRTRFWNSVMSTAAGGLCALYFSPLVLPMMEALKVIPAVKLNEVQELTLSGFLTGMLGLTICSWILDVARSKLTTKEDETKGE